MRAVLIYADGREEAVEAPTPPPARLIQADADTRSPWSPARGVRFDREGLDAEGRIVYREVALDGQGGRRLAR